MRIIVCIKQVPDTSQVRIDPKKGTLIRQGVPSIINPEDKHALEEALRIKERCQGEVTVVTMGPPQAEKALREALAMGGDRAVLLTDRAFAGSDTHATAQVLAAAVRKIRDWDLVLCGRQAIDGDTAQVGPQLAEYLGVPQVTYACKLHLEDGCLVAERALEDGFEKVKTRLPALVTVTEEINSPRYPSIRGIVQAVKMEIITWNSRDLGIEQGQAGLDGSPTKVNKTYTPKPRGEGEVIPGSPGEAARALLARLRERKVI